jgi:polyisoprenyl-teichoic acid--peptidoglycan teichoic acid transferase
MGRTPAVLDSADPASYPAADQADAEAAGRRGTSREPRVLSPSQRVRRAVTLLVISVLAPGSAQLAAGDRRIGRIALRTWLGVIVLAALAGLLAVIGRPVLLSLATSPVVLVLVSLACFAAAVAWPFLVADAWRLGRPQLLPGRSRIWVSVLAAVLVVATCLPLVGAGRRTWAAADFIHGVFGSGRASAANHGRFNVLLMGGDAGPDRVGTRPDSMTLVSIDEQTGRAVLFSLPRNLENVRFEPGSVADRAMPEGWSCGDKCLLNGIYTWGQEHKTLFPDAADPGAEAMKEAVAGVTGLKVNYYVLIDLKGFSGLIDAMGGIELTVNEKVPIGGGTSRVSGYIQPGHRHLDGYHALWFARSRHGASDYARMARQRCVMDAMLHQLDPGTVLDKFQDLAAAGKNVVSTDIPMAQLDTFIGLAAQAKGEPISSVQFVPPLIDPARPDLAFVRAKVARAVSASEKAPAPEKSPSAVKTSSSPTGGVLPSSSGKARHQPSAVVSPSASPAAEASDITAICSAG